MKCEASLFGHLEHTTAAAQLWCLQSKYLLQSWELPETNGLPCRLQKWSHNSWICAINYLARQAVYFPAQHLLQYVFNITAQVDWWFKFSTQRSPPKGFSYAQEPAMHNGSKQESQSHFNCAINCDFMISPWTYFYGREKCWEITRADGSRRMLRGSKWGNKFDLKGIHSRCAVPLNDFPLFVCGSRSAYVVEQCLLPLLELTIPIKYLVPG